MEAVIAITDRAARRIKEILAAASRGGLGLRVHVVGEGFSGLRYLLDLDLERAGDRLFEKDGAKILVDPKSLLYLNGTELDYRESLMGSSFVFGNPSATRACPCSTTFPVYSEEPYIPNIW